MPGNGEHHGWALSNLAPNGWMTELKTERLNYETQVQGSRARGKIRTSSHFPGTSLCRQKIQRALPLNVAAAANGEKRAIACFIQTHQQPSPHQLAFSCLTVAAAALPAAVAAAAAAATLPAAGGGRLPATDRYAAVTSGKARSASASSLSLNRSIAYTRPLAICRVWIGNRWSGWLLMGCGWAGEGSALNPKP